MKLHCYRFPEGTSDEVLLSEGCAVVLHSGETVYADVLTDEIRESMEYVDDVLEDISLSRAKELLKKYGGSAVTEHCDRSGCCFEVTEIKLTGNNSRSKYNKHL